VTVTATGTEATGAASRAASTPAPGGPLHRRLWSARWSYLFILPGAVLALMFTFYPVVASWYISFLEWSGLNDDRTFVGLDNYAGAVNDALFWDAFRRTFLFALVGVPATLALSLVVAIVLNNQALRMRAIFRTMFFLPVVTTTAIVGVVLSMIMNPFDGPLNAFLLTLGVVDAPIDFLGDPQIALYSVAGVWVWKWMGISMIYRLVAPQTVPTELYEAAQLDGAKRWQLHRYITLPVIAPFAVLITMLAFVGALQVFPLVQSMTQGGPALSTELVEVYIYRLAFAAETVPRLGYASAVAVFFGVAVLAFTLLQAWAARRTGVGRAVAD